MRSMKTLLRLMGAVTLSTLAASSVVACGPNTKAPALDGKYAALLNWYDADNKTTKIEQKLNKIIASGQEKEEIIAKDDMIKSTNFKDRLLVSGSAVGKWKAKSPDAAKFLADLRFESGNDQKDYSDNDVTAITNLKAEVTSSEAGKVEANTANNDFKVAAGTCQISIIKSNGDSKSYTINTLKKDTLAIPTEVAKFVTADSLVLTKEKGYVQDGKVLKFLSWKDNVKTEEKLYNFLVRLFGKESLIWTSDDAGKTKIDKYPTSGKAYLTIKFGDVQVLTAMDCGNLPTA